MSEQRSKIRALPSSPLSITLSTLSLTAWTFGVAGFCAIFPATLASMNPAYIELEHEHSVMTGMVWAGLFMVLGGMLAPAIGVAHRYAGLRQAEKLTAGPPPFATRETLKKPPLGMIIATCAWVFVVGGAIAITLIWMAFDELSYGHIRGGGLNLLVALPFAAAVWACVRWLKRYGALKESWASRIAALRPQWSRAGARLVRASREVEKKRGQKQLTVAAVLFWLLGFFGTLFARLVIDGDGRPGGIPDYDRDEWPGSLLWTLAGIAEIVFLIGVLCALMYGVRHVIGVIAVNRRAMEATSSSTDVADAVHYGHPLRSVGMLVMVIGIVIGPLFEPLGMRFEFILILVGAGIACVAVGESLDEGRVQRILDAHPTIDPGEPLDSENISGRIPRSSRENDA